MLGPIFQTRNIKPENLRVKNEVLLDILKMSKDIDFFNPNKKNLIIRKDIKFYENISACEPSWAGVPPLAYKHDPTYIAPISISYTYDSVPSTSDDDREDENSPPPLEGIPSAPQLPRWVRSTQDAACSLAGDPAD